MIALLHTIVWFFYFFGYLFLVWPILHKGMKALKAGNWAAADALTEKHVAKWANSLMRLAGVTVTTTGKENIPAGRPCVFVANHRGNYDIPLMLTQLDKAHPLLSKAEADRIPLIRGWMRLLHCVFVDRSDTRASLAALHEAMDLIKRGYSMVIFPEGTRFKGEEGGIGEFKGGAFRIATKTGAPIVPVAISNSRALMEANGNLMKPGHAVVRILPPIETAGLSRAEIAALPGRVQELIRQNIEVNREANLTAGQAEGTPAQAAPAEEENAAS